MLTCFAQIPDEFTTSAGEFTGYYWRTLSSGERLAFVLGFQAGHLASAPDSKAAIDASRKACLAQYANPDGKQQGECIGKSVSAKSPEYERWETLDPLPGGKYQDTIEATDRFFSEPENRVMSVNAAWIIAKWKQEGRPQSEVDSIMDSFRETYIRAPRKLCEMGFLMTAARCAALGTTLKTPTK